MTDFFDHLIGDERAELMTAVDIAIDRDIMMTIGQQVVTIIVPDTLEIPVEVTEYLTVEYVTRPSDGRTAAVCRQFAVPRLDQVDGREGES